MFLILNKMGGNQSINQSINLSIDQSIIQQAINQSINQCGKSVNPTKLNQSIDIEQSIPKSINSDQSINPTKWNQSIWLIQINEVINQSINQSINTYIVSLIKLANRVDSDIVIICFFTFYFSSLVHLIYANTKKIDYVGPHWCYGIWLNQLPYSHNAAGSNTDRFIQRYL